MPLSEIVAWIDEGLAQRLDDLCDAEQRSCSELIAEALRLYLQEPEARQSSAEFKDP
jgi:metal-responsive CopG/Arc/MetJ family transcriptional regulator